MKQRAVLFFACCIFMVLQMVLQACVIQRTIRTSGQAAETPVFETPPPDASAFAATEQATAVAPVPPPPVVAPQPTVVAQPRPVVATDDATSQVDVSRWLGGPGRAQAQPVPTTPAREFLGRSTMYPSTVTAYDWYAVKIVNRTGSIACLRVSSNGYGVPMLRRRAGARHEQDWIFSQDVPGLPCPEAEPSGGIINLATEGGQKTVRLVVEFYSSTVPPRLESRREYNYTFPYEFPIVNDPCTQAGGRCLYVTTLE